MSIVCEGSTARLRPLYYNLVINCWYGLTALSALCQRRVTGGSNGEQQHPSL